MNEFLRISKFREIVDDYLPFFFFDDEARFFCFFGSSYAGSTGAFLLRARFGFISVFACVGCVDAADDDDDDDADDDDGDDDAADDDCCCCCCCCCCCLNRFMSSIAC